MNTLKKLITLMIALMTASMAVAYDFEVNGIYYLINGTEATVTFKTPYYVHSDNYTGDVVIPETVTYNGVTYPVTAIGDNAFYWCDELTSIHIPKSIKRIEGNMNFYACEKLSIVEIESLESWCSIDFEISPGYSFSYSNPLSYSHHLYMNGKALTELVIPEGVNRIGKSALCKLSSFSRLEIPSSVTSIGDAAFNDCGSIDRLDIPDLETWIKIDIQGSESNPMGHARHIFLDGKEMSHDLVIPETATSISAGVFNGCQVITSVSIPPSVKTIGANAFLKCDSLERVEIQDVAVWCNIAFENVYSNPMSNTIPEAWWDDQEVTVFVNGTPVTQLDVPEGVTSIGDYAFAGASFDHVIVPNTIVSIGKSAFSHSGLKEVVLPENMESLGTYAFCDCLALKKVQISAGLKVIPEGAFLYCLDLSEVTIPSTVKRIEQHAFFDCLSLSAVPMTDSLQIIEDGAFHSTGIEYLITGQALTSIGDFAFADCRHLKKVEIGNQVTTLGESVFSDCDSLQNVIVGNGVRRIPKSFCSWCNELVSLKLGNGVDLLDPQCFEYCKKLNTIICKAVEPPMVNETEETFFHSSVFQNASLYVPEGAVEAYRTADVWKYFQNILDIQPGDVNGDGETTIADANSVIDVVIMGGNAGHTRIPEADVNGDGEISIADVNAIIDMILSQQL